MSISTQRQSGILLHPTSLPGPYGMGEIGPEAHRFLEVLAEMGQHIWQILPLGPTGYGDSPYQSLSTFAGNEMLISLADLVERGLLTAEEADGIPAGEDPHAIDYGPVLAARRERFRLLCRVFSDRASDAMKADFSAFCKREASWLDDYALFAAIKEQQELRPWTEWPEKLARRKPRAIKSFRRKNAAALRDRQLLQFIFDLQWRALRKKAESLEIRIVGDIPIFVAHDSADVWARRDLYFLKDDGQPAVEAGVPPDYFSATGQLWGNPLYDWERHAAEDYAWWVRRLRKVFDLVDIVRIDHFRGFEAYWEVPGGDETAMNGQWVKGPDRAFFDAIVRQLGDLPIIAEDLGVITDEVEALRDRYNFPGMKILQFEFGEETQTGERLRQSILPNSVVYTGTHDNDTSVGWYHSEPGEGSTATREVLERERHIARICLSSDGQHIHKDMIQFALNSPALTAVFPLQDLLGLGTEARMNLPGTDSGNWRWRFSWSQLPADLLAEFAQTVKSSGR